MVEEEEEEESYNLRSSRSSAKSKSRSSGGGCRTNPRASKKARLSSHVDKAPFLSHLAYCYS